MIAIIDYGAGNLFSVKNALDFLEEKSVITADCEEIRCADAMILPGVGAFPDAMRMLNEQGLAEVIKEEAQKKPLLGICLGMQMLFEKSYEFGETKGLGLIPGCVQLIDGNGLKIPHMGWNDLKIKEGSKLFAGWKKIRMYILCILLFAGGRSIDRCGDDRIRGDDSRICGERSHFCLPVPSGKEQYRRTSDTEKFYRAIGGMICIQRELFHVWM